MSAKPVFTITYWGVTGTLSAPLRPAEVSDKLTAAVSRLVEKRALQGLQPGPELHAQVRAILNRELPFHLRSTYGGNTTCVEVRTPDELIILDCGSGFRELGVALAARWRDEGEKAQRHAHILVSHPHMDHTFATPFFTPYYHKLNRFTLWGPQLVLDSLDAVLDPHSALSNVYFPPTFDQMQAQRVMRPVKAGDEFAVGSTRVRAHALNHPGGCLAYRLERDGRAFVFATDHEQPQVPDVGLAAFARGADLLYTEGQYTQAEYDGRVGLAGDPPLPRRGWGHTPVEACVVTAVAAGVRELHVGHRDPQRSDAETARIEALLQELLREELRRAGKPADACRALAPYEGLTIQL
jgi:phosphoribosyl 1,2-cyclic phosphodiesterase